MKALLGTYRKIRVAKLTLNAVLVAVLATPATAEVATARKSINPRSEFAKISGQISQLGTAASGEYGNAFFVGKDGCEILTNFHVAFGKSKDPKTGEVELVDKVDVGHVVNFSIDLDAKTGKFGRTLKAKVVEFGNYEYGTSRGFLGDLALLRLETCLGPQYAGPEIDRPAPGKRVPTCRLMTVSATRNDAGMNEIMVEEGCPAKPATAVTGMMISACESVPGMSGSMVLEQCADSKWRLVGVTTGQGAIENGKPLSKAIYASALNKFLDAAMGEAPMAGLAEERRPQAEEQTALVGSKARTVVR